MLGAAEIFGGLPGETRYDRVGELLSGDLVEPRHLCSLPYALMHGIDLLW
ncbi:hypothetical protein OG223_26690 [Streptomyces sp. NBC_01478]|nr:hypothetical protein [Streptomyces sp. NBC_01478]